MINTESLALQSLKNSSIDVLTLKYEWIAVVASLRILNRELKAFVLHLRWGNWRIYSRLCLSLILKGKSTGLLSPTTWIWSASSSIGCFWCGLFLRTPVTSTALPNVSNLNKRKKKKRRTQSWYFMYVHCSYQKLSGENYLQGIKILTDHSALNWRQSAMTAKSYHHSRGERDLSSEVEQSEPTPVLWHLLPIQHLKLLPIL